jgi:hypothetical protein
VSGTNNNLSHVIIVKLRFSSLRHRWHWPILVILFTPFWFLALKDLKIIRPPNILALSVLPVTYWTTSLFLANWPNSLAGYTRNQYHTHRPGDNQNFISICFYDKKYKNKFRSLFTIHFRMLKGMWSSYISFTCCFLHSHKRLHYVKHILHHIRCEPCKHEKFIAASYPSLIEPLASF